MIEIKINAHADQGYLRDQIDEAMNAIGYTREIAKAPSADLAAKTVLAEPAATEPVKPTATRRTKAQIAADERAAAAAQQAITASPENRVGPEDDPVVDAQDAADEAAETTTTEYSHDDVKKALGEYMNKFGMPAAQEDGTKALCLAFPDRVRPDEKVKIKISDIPNDQASLKKAVDGLKELLTKNPFKRDPIPPKA